MPLLFDHTELSLIETAVPLDNATETTLEDQTKAVEANNYTEIECCVLLVDPGTGAKSVAFTVYSGTAAMLDDGAWTAWTSVYTETVSLGTAAYAGFVSIKVDQKKFPLQYASFKAVVTHVDPGAGE